MAKEEFLKPFRIAEIIGSEIRELPAHEVIPTERQMSERFGVSRVTIQKALAHLEHEGLIYRRLGAGSFVSPLRDSKTFRLRSFTEEMALRGETVKAKIMSVSLERQDSEDSTDLPTLLGDAYRIERLRIRDKQPLAWDITYILQDVAPGLDKFDLSGSLYEVLEEKYNIVIKSADESISPIISDQQISKVLGVDKGTPALEVTRAGFDIRGELIESSKSIRRTDQWKFKYSVRR